MTDNPNAPIVIRILHGSYTGGGCQDPGARLFREDLGFGYSAEHPARAIWRDEPVQNPAPGAPRTRRVFEAGELIRLWPPTTNGAHTSRVQAECEAARLCARPAPSAQAPFERVEVAS